LKKQPEITITGDGSHTLYNSFLDETYHSTHGAIKESDHVFVQMGFHALKTNEYKILEIGFGTGLNALLTCIASEQVQKPVWYQTYELYPLHQETINNLNYPAKINLKGINDLFQEIHACPWDKWCKLSTCFNIQKFKKNILTAELGSGFNLVYYDAFAPSRQPELWHFGLIKKIHDALCPGGILVTYTAKGEVRRNLMKAGFMMEKIPGPPGKREMLRGVKE
jgi:tRNA U34 5-methylaminomethyl-2-thiouridine-forming methyltransferase MnmC